MSETAENLLVRILTQRREQWTGRGKYKEPVSFNKASTFEIPETWVWASLDQLVLNITDGDHQAPPQTKSGIPFLVIGNIRSGSVQFEGSRFVGQEYYESLDAFRTPTQGDLLYSLVGSFGIAVLVDTPAPFCVQRHIGILRPHDESPTRYILNALNAGFVYRQASEVATGTAQKTVPLSGLRKIAIPLPPLPEQRRIVARIEELFSRLDAGVAALRHAKAQLQRYRQSVLAAAVTGQLTQAWREQHPDIEPAKRLLERILKERREQWDGRGKYKEPLGYSRENPFDTPPSWVLTNFEQVSRRVTVGHVGSMKDEYTESGVPFLRGQNVRANRFDPKGLKFVSKEFHLSLSKSLIRGGDIAVTRSGDVGIACVIPEELGEANCSDLVLIQGPVLLNPYFAAYYMNSLGRRLVRAGKVGVAITHFNTQAVAAMPLPLPPLAEQHQIVAEVEARTTAIDHLEAELDRQITRSNRLRQSTLASAFCGQL